MDRLLTYDEALDRILAAISSPLPAESTPLANALGRVLGEAVTSRVSLPPWDNSSMDGYAIRAADVTGAADAAPSRLAVVGEVRAGQAPDATVGAGQAIRIATGAPIPPGADAVVPVEATTPLDPAGVATGPRGREATGPLPARIDVHAAVVPGAWIRREASDLAAGTTVLPAGTTLTPAAIGLVAAIGLDTVRVHRRPTVGVVTTGDEIRQPGEPLGPAGIPDANGPALMAMVEASGAQAVSLGLALDRIDDVRARFHAGLADGLDVIIASGGVSVGPYDVVRSAFEPFGSIDLWRVAVQPGKPFAFGRRRLEDETGAEPGTAETLFFGLPGNPVSTFVTFELFVRPALRRLAGLPDAELARPVDRAILLDAVTKDAGRRAFIRVVADRDPTTRTPIRDEMGRVRVRLAGGQGSHVLSALAAAEALAVIPEDGPTRPAGSAVDLIWLGS
jgi:molybdopterin molybdotransferase